MKLNFNDAIETNNKPLVLCILDGWGISSENGKNAVKKAKTPNFDRYSQNFPLTTINASGVYVGLPEGQVGNSEVGHMNLGSGRLLKQDLVKIDEAIKRKEFYSNKLIKNFVRKIKKSKGVAHIIGLVSDGGVHSKDRHIIEISKVLTSFGLQVKIHVFTDGRDTLPKIAIQTIPKFEQELPKGSRIVSIMGRFFSMDRDSRWERTQVAWETIALGQAQFLSKNSFDAINSGYQRNEIDEFLKPTIIEQAGCESFKGINDNDGLFVANFRSDRMRQLLSSLIDLNFRNFKRKKKLKLISELGMVDYFDNSKNKIDCLFPNNVPKNTLGEVISRNNLKQFRVAETEKYPHVTFFFNGGREKRFKGEERALIPSPKVKTYDEFPQMSAKQITLEVKKSITAQKHDVIIVNFANPDMVGHTGDFDAVVEAVEYVDQCVGDIVNELLSFEGQMILTSDHGNCEVMWDRNSNLPHTAHTINTVPLIFISKRTKYKLKKGSLEDIAPTMLELLNIPKPIEMSGKSLIK